MSHSTSTGGPVPVITDYTNHAYCAAVEQAGGTPLLLPVPIEPTDMDPVLDFCHGLLIPGGLDVDPRFYPEDPIPQLGALDGSMDWSWIHAANYALERGLFIKQGCSRQKLLLPIFSSAVTFRKSANVCTFTATASLTGFAGFRISAAGT